MSQSSPMSNETIRIELRDADSSQAMALADRLAAVPTAPIAQLKKLLEASALNDFGSHLKLERQAQIESGKTKDFIEGVSAFLEKRRPRFVGG
jgi:2-(1,2-epoxy-1,2-dihydrophenyl)acetyl-CoA isomerase